MRLEAFVALVRKDLQLFFSDRRAVILTFAVPIAIASFFGSIFKGASDDSAEPARIPIAIVDRDDSAISKGIVSAVQTDKIWPRRLRRSRERARWCSRVMLRSR